MIKEELIKEIKELKYHNASKKSWIDRELVLDLVEQLDEPQKPVVPQFVANWINYCKLTSVDLYHAFEMGDLYLGNYAYQKDYPKLKGYFESENNQETFARAWLNGYTVEEKRYLVKMKGLDIDEAFLKFQLDDEYWYMGIVGEYKHARGRHTRKELENAGFGDVFNCPLFEVDEVD